MNHKYYMLFIRNDYQVVPMKTFNSLNEMLKEAKNYAESGVDCWMKKTGEDNYFLRYYKANNVVVEVL